ncbi:hypothetical protein DFS34DRAFT_134326 [Phlyctochytrium arcticum]|nr:hypothetical protein DFS34DRAFT_134326 [Phlyctochytrium arcticum]
MVAIQALASLLPLAASVFSSGQTTSLNVVLTSRQPGQPPSDQCVQRMNNLASFPSNPSCQAAALATPDQNNIVFDATWAKCMCPIFQNMSDIVADKECLAYAIKQKPELAKADSAEQITKEMNDAQGILAPCAKGDFEAAAKELNDRKVKNDQAEKSQQSGGLQSLAIGYLFMMGTAVATSGAVLGMF